MVTNVKDGPERTNNLNFLKGNYYLVHLPYILTLPYTKLAYYVIITSQYINRLQEPSRTTVLH